MLTVAVPSPTPPRLRLRWILIAWWGVAALSGAGHLVFFNLVDGHGDFTWWGPIVTQLIICTAWALFTPLVFRIARDLGDDLRPARIAGAIAWGLMLSAAMSTSRSLIHGLEHAAGVVCNGGWFTRMADYMTLDVPLFAAVLAAGLARRYLLQREAQQARAAAIEVQLAESRLHALQMQLNPHFLFNTLNTISALVESDPVATRTVVARLSELLRRTLDVAQQPEVRLAEELQFIRGYLEIMKHRFSDRLTTAFAIEDGLDDALVPAFVLQPLVENAIEHGIGRIRGLGALELRIERCGDQLHITVRDNGPGLDPTAREGIGLSNTAARLAQLYPGRSALRLADDGERGAVAVVELPYHTLDEEVGA
ncbi:MAG TPA: histidine kinase [Kofleriaceae bacterium]|nr:histidine kinase [Kofleriaceae bacterium]